MFPGELAVIKRICISKLEKLDSLFPLTKLADLVEDWDAQSYGDEVVLPDPLVVEVMFNWELGDLCREGVGEFHRTSWSVCHFDFFVLVSKNHLQKLKN